MIVHQYCNGPNSQPIFLKRITHPLYSELLVLEESSHFTKYESTHEDQLLQQLFFSHVQLTGTNKICCTSSTHIPHRTCHLSLKTTPIANLFPIGQRYSR
uniref:Uncharacterized protein n=1 Tax=Zea mays TaxID=4577 RepID=A0A804N0W9_MAIZE